MCHQIFEHKCHKLICISWTEWLRYQILKLLRCNPMYLLTHHRECYCCYLFHLLFKVYRPKLLESEQKIEGKGNSFIESMSCINHCYSTCHLISYHHLQRQSHKCYHLVLLIWLVYVFGMVHQLSKSRFRICHNLPKYHFNVCHLHFGLHLRFI